MTDPATGHVLAVCPQHPQQRMELNSDYFRLHSDEPQVPVTLKGTHLAVYLALTLWDHRADLRKTALCWRCGTPLVSWPEGLAA